MKPNTQKIYELTAQATDIFNKSHGHISTSVGLMNKALRDKGIEADAVMVDAIVSKNRLIFVLLDADPSIVGIGLGNIIEDNINLVDKVTLEELTAPGIAVTMIKYLT